jgi:hypothetical protein
LTSRYTWVWAALDFLGKLLVSFFTTPIAELTTGDLQSLLDDNAVENILLEFKVESPSKDETLKKLSSFANTFGGFLVIGARASSADGRLNGLPGVEPESGFKQRIVQWCFDAVSPPLLVAVSDPIPAPLGDGKVCYVLHTAESDLAPHFLNGRKGVYVRTDEFSARFEARLANENELRHLFERRRLVRERRARLAARARRRFDTYAKRRYAEINSGAANSGCRIELCAYPRFPSLPLCDESMLQQVVTSEAISWRQTRLPRLNGNPVTQHESVIILGAAEEFSLFEANIWGLFFYGTQIDMNQRGTTGIHAYHLAGYIVAALRHASFMWRLLNYSGPVLIETSLASILGVDWLTSGGGSMMISRPGSELDDDVSFSVASSTDAMSASPDDVEKQILRSVFFSANLAEMVDTPQKVEGLRRQAYEYNFWPRPSE